MQYWQADVENRSRRRNIIFVAVILLSVVAVIAIILSRLGQESFGDIQPANRDEMILTSNIDARQQVEARQLGGYDWAVLLSSPLDDKSAMRAVPYLATLELENAALQNELLERSGRYASPETIGSLKPVSGLADIMDNMAVVETGYYRLGLPSGNAHAERFKHLSGRLRVYGPPSGPIQDFETQLFVQQHMGFSVDTHEKWYALMNHTYRKLISDMAENVNKTSMLSAEDYFGARPEGGIIEDVTRKKGE